MKLLLGSRGSRLALWQAQWVKQRLEGLGHEAEVKVIKTTGDKLTAPLPAGSKGMFIKEIEEALAAGTVDIAVHSLKDLPVEQIPGLRLAAIPPREDARDVLVARQALRFAALPAVCRIATGSLRRASQVRILRSDVEVVSMRGNVDTRLAKLDRGECDALMMAAAGLHRLGLMARISEYFDPEQICPAVGQGALGLEVRADDERVAEAIHPLDDPPSRQTVTAERAALKHLGGGCQTPIAANARIDGGRLEILGLVSSPDGSRAVRARAAGAPEEAEIIGAQLAADLLKQGAATILNWDAAGNGQGN